MLLCWNCNTAVGIAAGAKFWHCVQCHQGGPYTGSVDTWSEGVMFNAPYWKEDAATIWFSADFHFGHNGILTSQLTRGADFASVDEMDAAIIDGINAVVKPRHTLYCIGDFGWQASRYGHYRQRLKVRELHIVRGNHDRPSLAQHCSTYSDMLYRKFKWPGLDHRVKVHMTHYPVLSWDGLHHGGIHLYGHGHGIYEDNLDKIHPGRRSMDVGIDNIHKLTGEWRPISLGEVIDRLGGDVTSERLPGPFENVN